MEMNDDPFVRAMSEQFRRLASGLWIPGKEEATTCASIPQLTQEQFKYEYLGRFDAPPPLPDQKTSYLMQGAMDALLYSMEQELFRSIVMAESLFSSPKRTPRIDFIESVHCTTTVARWIRVRRSWQERLCGSSLSLQQASLALAALLAASISFGLLPLCLFMALVIIRPRRWRASQKPVKTWEQVPDPDVYLLHGRTLIGHPATITMIKQAMAK
jgi:hypothetical protein